MEIGENGGLRKYIEIPKTAKQVRAVYHISEEPGKAEEKTCIVFFPCPLWPSELGIQLGDIATAMGSICVPTVIEIVE